MEIDDVVEGLDAAILKLDSSAIERGPARHIQSIVIFGDAELLADEELCSDTDLVIATGTVRTITAWTRRLRSVTHKPAGLVVKEFAEIDELRNICRTEQMPLFVIDSRARWELVFSQLQRQLQRRKQLESEVELASNGLDTLAEVTAEGTGGLVTIEDAQSQRVLAYSTSGDGADELRTRAILGRAAPEDSVRWLKKSGVISAINTPQRLVEVPEVHHLGMERRLVTGIHDSSGTLLGSIWVQQGDQGFSPAAGEIVLGAAIAAAELLGRDTQLRSTEQRMLGHLFGEDSAIASRTAADYFSLPDDCEPAIIGIHATDGNEEALTSVFKLLVLQVNAFAPTAVAALIGGRAYVLLPRPGARATIVEWLDRVLTRFSFHPVVREHSLQAAIAVPVPRLDQVPAARREVDRVLNATDDTTPRVTSFTESRTSILLRESLDLLDARPELKDPRIDDLANHDERNGSSLVTSLQTYLRAGRALRETARRLNVHPNTLRYRIERAQEVTGLNLNDPRDRLLTEIQLVLRQK